MSKSKKVLGNVGIFVLIAALVYLAGRALLAVWPMWSTMMGGSGLLGMLPMLLFWGGVLALVAWLLVSLFRRDRGKEGSGASLDAAEQTLRERFARGEISTEEYEEALRVLRSRVVGSASGDARASKASLSTSRQGIEGHSTPDDAAPSDNGGRARRGA